MCKRIFSFQQVLALGMISTLPLCAATISVGSPVAVTSSNNVAAPPVISGTSTNLLVGYRTSSFYWQTATSVDGGNTWKLALPIYGNGKYTLWVDETQNASMVTFIDYTAGGVTSTPRWSASLNQGASWNGPSFILPGPNRSTSIYTPTVVAGNSSGFMVTWRDSADNNAYAAYTSNNGATWSTPVAITSSGDVNSAVMVSCTDSTFIATWTNSSGNACSAYSLNNGTSWSSASQINQVSDVASDTWVVINTPFAMAAWVDASGNAYSCISGSAGAFWMTPTQIATNVLNNPSPTNVSMTVSTSAFIAAWIGSDHNAYISVSGDNGASWTTPSAMTTDGSVAVGNIENGGNGCSFICVTPVGDNCYATWLDNNGNVQVCPCTVNP